MSENYVVVTGCSTGIGRCAAAILAGRGYNVIATLRDTSGADELLALGVKEVVALELADPVSVAAAVERILAISNGKIHVLFNNAAYGQAGAVEDLSREALRHQFEVNLFGTHELTVGLLPAMLKMADARIIQNSSVLGFVAMPMRGAYNASKFALEGLTDTLRLELAGTSVKVVLIEPGPIVSNFRANALASLKRAVDFSKSRHQAAYQSAVERLSKPGPAAPFTLPPEAVVQKLIAAIESRKPKRRYKVTFPTYLMAVLKVVLPGSLMDKVLLASGK